MALSFAGCEADAKASDFLSPEDIAGLLGEEFVIEPDIGVLNPPLPIIEINEVTFIKSYNIPCALPSLTNIQYVLNPSETQLTDSIYLAGDTMLNGSLNAAMLSGELAAQAVHEKITGTVLG